MKQSEPPIIVLSPLGKYSHLIAPGAERTFCGKLAENWPIGGVRRERPPDPPDSVSCRPCRSKLRRQP
jgi:hypothetical protein